MVQFLVEHGACIYATTIRDNETAAEKCEEEEDNYATCSQYLLCKLRKSSVLKEKRNGNYQIGFQ